MKLVRVLAVVGALFAVLVGGALAPAAAQTVPPSGSLIDSSVSCGAVSGTVLWLDVPEDGYVSVEVFNPLDPSFNYDEFQNVDGDSAGFFEFDIDFPTQTYDGWVVELWFYDGSGNPIGSTVLGTVDRDCIVGSVSGGRTGSDDDAPAPIDARSDATTEVEEEEPVEDPDGEGRVQVP